MFWNEEKREYQPHPDCTCGQGEAWKRGNYRPCHCAFLRPLNAQGQPVPNAIIDGLREGYLSNWGRSA